MNHVIDQALTKINVQNKPIALWRYVDDIFVAFNDMSALDIFFNTLNSVHSNITFAKELECGDSLAFLDVLIQGSPNFFVRGPHKLLLNSPRAT